MKLMVAACLAACCAVGVAAQTTEQTTKSKLSVKDGKDVTVTGCVEPMASGTGYMLTNVADKRGALHSYMLVSDDVDLTKHVGQRVEIKGKATDRGDQRIRRNAMRLRVDERREFLHVRMCISPIPQHHREGSSPAQGVGLRHVRHVKRRDASAFVTRRRRDRVGSRGTAQRKRDDECRRERDHRSISKQRSKG